MGSLKTGIFVREEKNRFLCTVEIDGLLTECYIPSSCRLSNFLNLTGRKVLLKPIAAKNARTQFMVFGVSYHNRVIPLQMTLPNEVIEKNLKKRRFSFLGKRSSVQREINVSNYKCDLFIPESKTIIEIKSILCLDQRAFFPTIESERACRQLHDILGLLAEGYNIYYFLVSLNAGVKSICINSCNSQFYDLFMKCIEEGMQCKAFSLIYNNNSVNLHREISLELTI